MLGKLLVRRLFLFLKEIISLTRHHVKPNSTVVSITHYKGISLVLHRSLVLLITEVIEIERILGSTANNLAAQVRLYV